MQWTYKGKQQMSSKLSGGESFISFYIQLIMGSFADMQQINSIRFVIFFQQMIKKKSIHSSILENMRFSQSFKKQ